LARFYLQLFVGGIVSCSGYLLVYVFMHSGVQHILCCVFVLFFVVLCTLCSQFLWLAHFLLPLQITIVNCITACTSIYFLLWHFEACKSVTICKQTTMGRPEVTCAIDTVTYKLREMFLKRVISLDRDYMTFLLPLVTCKYYHINAKYMINYSNNLRGNETEKWYIFNNRLCILHLSCNDSIYRPI